MAKAGHPLIHASALLSGLTWSFKSYMSVDGIIMLGLDGKMDDITRSKTLTSDIENRQECQPVFPDNAKISLLSGQICPDNRVKMKLSGQVCLDKSAGGILSGQVDLIITGYFFYKTILEDNGERDDLINFPTYYLINK